ncbi:formate--tetrahydrofolate ligase [Corynebacterium epidermidicanis]|uniref:Formate--tetrahydrofolate ligase n=1 Tax=Corynebacterium epidermidicanis TaxID=1050174 RepID=A0A0G3GPU4_9CORY|nr:formate--tetrahydrofolate ligase [Corynebacterium epidermidicanis]AKK03149.1 Formate-tetrahydrofolate ligase [Corynebacterium epidermidicanis]
MTFKQPAEPTVQPQPSDAEIALTHSLLPISDIAERAGLPVSAVIGYGRNKAKIDVASLGEKAHCARLVLVTAMSPTPAGEGKSTVLIGLSDAVRAAGQRTIVAIREPSQGPVMGIKGGAAGGGYSQIVPMDDINLHFTGDLHAIAAANNTLAALIDNHIQQGNELRIDPRRITWRRCLDVNDRSLRNIVTGLGGPAHGTPIETGFDITAASEIMAVLCLAKDFADLKTRIGNIVVGQNYDQQPVFVKDLQVAGSLAAQLRDAINPNLVQTLGGTPAFVHGGPFANIAHGCNSLIATNTAMQYADIVLTEAGFGSDLGAEKFFDIKARAGGFDYSAVVVVATIRSLKFNGGLSREELNQENLVALEQGLANLTRHCTNIAKFGQTPIVALNRFTADTSEEVALVKTWGAQLGFRVVETEVWSQGGEGARELADAVLEYLESHEPTNQPLYDPALGIEASLNTIAREIYGAAGVQLSGQALKDLAYLKANGWDTLPVCVSKTQYSFSDDPSALGAPTGHTLHVRALRPRTGAGFVVALTGDVMTMPGLPKLPAALNIDVDDEGQISGLF